NTSANLGNEIAAQDINCLTSDPVVKWTARADTLYTLAMLDPDVPSRADPSQRSVKHWLVMNIAGDRIQSGDIVSAFIPPAPERGTGNHRYVMLVYRQSKRLTPPPRDDCVTARVGFNWRGFVTEYNLGQPVAGNFWLTQWDPSVDEWRAANGL
ncbi:unnamed protein product, partial [Medioppia subpectinata]